MTRAATRVRYDGQEATPEPPRRKTKSRSLPARHGGQAAGRPHHHSPTAGDPSCVRAGRVPLVTVLRAGGMTDIARRSLIGNDMHSPASASPLPTRASIFLIGNEFHLQRAAFRHLFAGQLSKRPTGEAPQRHGFSLFMRFLNSNRVNMGN